MSALEVELDFVDDVPAPKRRRMDGPRVVVRSSGRPTKVTETGDRYVAPDSHRPHGTYVKYVVEKCRCLPCTEANRAYELRRQHAINRPDQAWVPYVPAMRARRHLLELAEAGVGYKTVATIAGLAPSTVAKIVWPSRYRGMGTSRGIRPETEAKILAVTLDRVDGGQRVDGAATWALVDDLLGQGFYMTWIIGQLRLSTAWRRRPQVRASTARKVETLHRTWSGKTPPRKGSRWHP